MNDADRQFVDTNVWLYAFIASEPRKSAGRGRTASHQSVFVATGALPTVGFRIHRSRSPHSQIANCGAAIEEIGQKAASSE